LTYVIFFGHFKKISVCDRNKTALTWQCMQIAEVRWFSRRKVVDCFMELLLAVHMFLEEEGRHDIVVNL